MNNQEIEFYQQVTLKQYTLSDKSIRYDKFEDNVEQSQSDSTQITSKLITDQQNSHNKRQNLCLWITIFIGIIFHIIFAMSIFDVYIQSWKAIGVAPVQPLNEKPLSKRIIMFQLDGARADTFFSYQTEQDEPEIGKPRVAFIHDLIKNGNAAFGISHASVPTESRSCAQTMMGGYFEDMTAILSGWAEAGEKYDGVFNYVNAGWFFGPQMIQTVFDSSNCPQCVRKEFYPNSDISYSDFELMKSLDDFSLNHLNDMFQGSLDGQTDIESKKFDVENLKKDKIIVYANLAGTDASGHQFKPNSWQYRQNMKRNGEELKKIIDKIEEFYKFDNQTTFIVTSDHGMADMGAHGDGNPQNTRTPFVIWGAGIAPAQNEENPEYPKSHDDYSKPWKLNMKVRFDINQNSIPSLISSILGIPIPTNNEGVVPLQFLYATNLYKANAILQNAKQLVGSYQKLEEEAQNKLKWFFTTYKYSSNKIKQVLDDIQNSINNLTNLSSSLLNYESEYQKNELELIIFDIENVIYRIQQGNNYIMLYQKRPLQVVVGLGYLGFMAFCLISIAKYINATYKSEEKDTQFIEKFEETHKNIPILKILTCIFASISLLYLVITSAPYAYYAYFGFPIFFFNVFFSQLNFLAQSWNYSLLQMIGVAIGVTMAGASLMYSFFDRNFISFIFISLAMSTILYNKWKYNMVKRVVVQWSLSCCAISVFPLLPVIEQINDTHYIIGFGMIVIMLFSISFGVLKSELQTSVKVMTINTIYCGFISLYINYLIDSQIEVPSLILSMNWCVLFALIGSVFILDLHSKSNYSLRFYTLIVIVSNIFLLLGIGHDVIFVVVFTILLKNWISYEQYQASMETLNEEEQSYILPQHFFVAFKLLLLMNTSFFGTGNMISISSFNMSSVNRFVITLREFVITLLAILKLCQPFLATSAAFVCICKTAFKKINSIGLFLLSLILVEIMTFYFFFMVRTEGTWQEKGSSVARFVISSLLILTYTILFIISLLFFKKVTSNSSRLQQQ